MPRGRRHRGGLVVASRASHAPHLSLVIDRVHRVRVVVGWSRPASALQPLAEFVHGARAHNPQNEEARANRAGAAARADEALGRALPGLSAGGTYTRNQWEIGFGGPPVIARNQLDASVTLAVPLVDLAKFARISAANRSAEAAAHQEDAIAREVEAQVVQLYYQLAADLALVEAARKALDVARIDLERIDQSARAGTATALDVARATAEVERRSQQLTIAELAGAAGGAGARLPDGGRRRHHERATPRR